MNSQKNKVIFLDFDGVVTHRHYMLHGKGSVDEFDPTCIARLMRILQATSAKVVIHSTWINIDTETHPFPDHILKRLKEGGFDLDFLHEDWAAKGLKPANVNIWLLRHTNDVGSYIILEDELSPFFNKRKNVVWIENGWYEYGIQEQHVKESILKLGKEYHEM